MSIVTKARSKPYQKVSVTDLKALSRSTPHCLSLPLFRSICLSMSMLCLKASWLIHKQFWLYQKLSFSCPILAALKVFHFYIDF